MGTNFGKLAPYAPFGCVITVIRRLRERGLPESLTMSDIVRAGVSEGNASRTLQALKFLKLVDEEGYRTSLFDRLARVPTGEYAEIFCEIIEEAYKDVFAVIDPADATDIEMNDAFRSYQPQAQRARMVTLFKSLCQEAGLIAGGSPSTRKRPSTSTTHRPRGTSSSTSIQKASRESLPTTDNLEMSNRNSSVLEAEYGLLQELLQQLPPNKVWTQERRDRWLQAFTASIDLLIDIEP